MVIRFLWGSHMLCRRIRDGWWAFLHFRPSDTWATIHGVERERSDRRGEPRSVLPVPHYVSFQRNEFVRNDIQLFGDLLSRQSDTFLLFRASVQLQNGLNARNHSYHFERRKLEVSVSREHGVVYSVGIRLSSLPMYFSIIWEIIFPSSMFDS